MTWFHDKNTFHFPPMIGCSSPLYWQMTGEKKSDLIILNVGMNKVNSPFTRSQWWPVYNETPAYDCLRQIRSECSMLSVCSEWMQVKHIALLLGKLLMFRKCCSVLLLECSSSWSVLLLGCIKQLIAVSRLQLCASVSPWLRLNFLLARGKYHPWLISPAVGVFMGHSFHVSLISIISCLSGFG